MRSDPHALLTEVAMSFELDSWLLVGGLMVHCHAQRAGVTHVRPTDDADIVVELQSGAYVAHALALADLGFTPREPVDAAAPFHRFVRDGDTVDLMVSDRESWPPRYLGRDLVKVPGSGSALKRSIVHLPPAGSASVSPTCLQRCP